jgi:hypothetical protein
MSQISIPSTVITWKTNSELSPGDASRVRGFLGAQWPNLVQFHHHLPGGRLMWSHPQIQVKIIEGQVVLTGIAEGSMLLDLLPTPDALRLGQKVVKIVETKRASQVAACGPVEEELSYEFLTPWLSLNPQNHELYQGSSDQKREEVLTSIMISNLLSFSKSIHLTVTSRLRPRHRLTVEEIRVKGVSLLGFRGVCKMAFQLPPLWGIGKMSSRGFGTTKAL